MADYDYKLIAGCQGLAVLVKISEYASVIFANN